MSMGCNLIEQDVLQTDNHIYCAAGVADCFSLLQNVNAVKARQDAWQASSHYSFTQSSSTTHLARAADCWHRYPCKCTVMPAKAHDAGSRRRYSGQCLKMLAPMVWRSCSRWRKKLSQHALPVTLARYEALLSFLATSVPPLCTPQHEHHS